MQFSPRLDAAYLIRGQVTAIGAIGIAVAVRFALELAWPQAVVPFATYFPAVMVVGFFGGALACATGVILSVLSAWFLFLGPVGSFNSPTAADAVNLVLFSVAITAIGTLAVLLRTRVDDARRADQRLQRAQKAGGTADWEWDVENDRVIWSRALYDLHGLPPADANPSPNTVFKAIHADDLAHVKKSLARARQTGDPLVMEYRVVRGDGSIAWLLSRAEAQRSRDGKQSRIVGVNIDITARKAAEQRTELLFHELNHRVKNNFQVVASLLRMQAARVGDSAAREHLNNAMRRVMTMADVHGSLYKAGRVNTVDFAEYMRDLCEKISNSVLLNSRVKCHVRADTAVLKVDRAIPLGLVVNELVMNSIKHAFPGGAEGEIHVIFGPVEDRFLLAVTDDGVGLSRDDGAPAATGGGFSGGGAGLGMRLVEAFTQQAGGELKFERGRRGARFEIWLPSELFVASDLDDSGETPSASKAAGSR